MSESQEDNSSSGSHNQLFKNKESQLNQFEKKEKQEKKHFHNDLSDEDEDVKSSDKPEPYGDEEE